jgi:hypothetical protein
MIEAMATGTPVVAWRNGSVPDVIDHGLTGMVVDAIEEAVDAVRVVRNLDRTAVRKQFERRFTVNNMTQQYIDIYEHQATGARASRLGNHTHPKRAFRNEDDRTFGEALQAGHLSETSEPFA